MGCTSEMVDKVGCEQMPINCAATDTAFIFASSNPKYASLQTCLKKKCGSAPNTQTLYQATVTSRDFHHGWHFIVDKVSVGTVVCAAVAISLVAARFVHRSRSVFTPLTADQDECEFAEEEY